MHYFYETPCIFDGSIGLLGSEGCYACDVRRRLFVNKNVCHSHLLTPRHQTRTVTYNFTKYLPSTTNIQDYQRVLSKEEPTKIAIALRFKELYYRNWNSIISMSLKKCKQLMCSLLTCVAATHSLSFVSFVCKLIITMWTLLQITVPVV